MRRDRTGELLVDDDVAPVSAAATDEHRCTDGWTGHDAAGRPSPCWRCRPNLTTVGRPPSLAIVPPSPAMLTMSERQWQECVLQLAGLRRWKHFHAYSNRRSPSGWPDLCLVRGPRLIFAELKTSTGRVRPEQRVWLDALALVPSAECYVWRPSSWSQVQAVLA